MARPFPLESVRQILHRKAEDAAAELRGHGERLRAAEAKQAELERYLGEYRAQQQETLRSGTTAARLRGFDDFLLRIKTAIDAQRVEVERHRALWESARAHWAEQSRREQAFEVLAAQHAAREARRDLRAEQKLLDEFSARTRGRAPDAGA